MRKSRKFSSMLFAATAAFMIFGLCSCSQGPSKIVDGELYPEGKNWEMITSKPSEPVNITMWIPNSATSTMGVGIQTLADLFNQEQATNNPGKNITVTVEYQGKSSTLNEKLQASILSGNNPVISAIGVSSVPLFASKTIDLRRVFTYEELQAQNQGLLQYSLYNGAFVLNPYFPSASNIIVANKTLMSSKGVTLPTAADIIKQPKGDDWTWDKFIAAAKKVTDTKKGIYGFASNSLDPIGMMYQQGGSLYNKTVTELAFTKDDKFAKGLEFWRSLVTENCMLNPNSRSNHGTIIVSEFYEQKVGMIYTTSSNIVSFSKQAKENNYELEVLPFPKKTDYFTNQGGSGIVILNNKPQKEIDAAAEFLRWLNKPSNIAKMCKASGYLPLHPAAMNEPELVEIYEETPLLKTAAELMIFGVKSPQGKAKVACDSEINKYCKYIWTEPNMSIEEIVKAVTERAQYTIEANQ